MEYQIDKQNLKIEFYAEYNHANRTWFFDKYKGQGQQKIQEEFYGFLRKIERHIQFFDWFEIYLQRNGIDYPFSQTTNVVKR